MANRNTDQQNDCEHPQPLFDFLMSLPTDRQLDRSIVIDWQTYSDEAEKGDDIRDHPEIWGEMQIPEELENLNESDTVAVRQFDGRLNLNAIAIGLGTEKVRYDPESFPALTYTVNTSGATVFVWWYDVIVSVGESEEHCTSAIESACQRLENLGLTDEVTFEDAIRIMQGPDFFFD
ncbi:hypothetical protein [Halovenus sp. HT40]|uniref:hypothetical protein n=1 Tax=Halovenus sp. HT40 TaxID=3126691 RepID=UPI00300E78FF